MSSQFSSRTGLPMVDLFFNGVAAMFEMQRGFAARGMMTVPVSTNFGRSDQGRHMHQSQGIGATEEQVIPIPTEELRVGKRQVQSAKAYRVSTTVVKVPVEEQVSLRAETVVIERRPTAGTTVRGGESFQDHTIEVHEMYEEPVIGKVITQAEEMVIYKTLSERTATVRETVRQTRVNVEGPAKVQLRPPVEIARENSLKVSVPPQVATARDTGAKNEQKAQAHPQAKVEVAAGFRTVPGGKLRKLAVVQSLGERKGHTNSGRDGKTPRRA